MCLDDSANDIFYFDLQENELQEAIVKNTHLTVQNSDLQRRLDELEKVGFLKFYITNANTIKCIAIQATQAIWTLSCYIYSVYKELQWGEKKEVTF